MGERETLPSVPVVVAPRLRTGFRQVQVQPITIRQLVRFALGLGLADFGIGKHHAP